MSDLLVHPKTKTLLGNEAASPAHGIVLVGAKGIGKKTLGRRLASELLHTTADSITANPFTLIISPADGSIGIEVVRRLDHFLSLLVPGEKDITNRIVLIEDADSLTLEAQNALLKTLEEPPSGTVIILTAADEQRLLPTLRSRLRRIRVIVPDKDSTASFFTQRGHNLGDVGRAMNVSGGLPGLMSALLDNANHPLQHATELARQLLQSPLYERLLLVDELSKTKQVLDDTCYILEQMSSVALRGLNAPQARRWQTILRASYQARKALQASVQPKLVATTLMLSL